MINAKLAEVRISKEDVERAIAKHLIAIRDIYHVYNPEGNYLDMTIWYDSTDGNDRGDWKAWSISAHNAHWENPDRERPLDLYGIKNVKDAQYWVCVTADEDAEAEEQRQGDPDYFEDGTILSHRDS